MISNRIMLREIIIKSVPTINSILWYRTSTCHKVYGGKCPNLGPNTYVRLIIRKFMPCPPLSGRRQNTGICTKFTRFYSGVRPPKTGASQFILPKTAYVRYEGIIKGRSSQNWKLKLDFIVQIIFVSYCLR